MKIKYTDKTIIKQFTEQEINEILCRLLAFCRINKDNDQIRTLSEQLENLEELISKGNFNN